LIQDRDAEILVVVEKLRVTLDFIADLVSLTGAGECRVKSDLTPSRTRNAGMLPHDLVDAGIEFLLHRGAEVAEPANDLAVLVEGRELLGREVEPSP